MDAAATEGEERPGGQIDDASGAVGGGEDFSDGQCVGVVEDEIGLEGEEVFLDCLGRRVRGRGGDVENGEGGDRGADVGFDST